MKKIEEKVYNPQKVLLDLSNNLNNKDKQIFDQLASEFRSGKITKYFKRELPIILSGYISVVFLLRYFDILNFNIYLFSVFLILLVVSPITTQFQRKIPQFCWVNLLLKNEYITENNIDELIDPENVISLASEYIRKNK